MPDLDPIDELRASLKAAEQLARDPEAFSAAHDAFARLDSGRYQSILDELGLTTECRRICWIFCEKRCLRFCFSVCPEPPPEPDPEEIREFVAAMARVDKRSLERLVAAAEKEDEKAFKTLWKRLGLSVDWRQEYATIDAWIDANVSPARRADFKGFARMLWRIPTVGPPDVLP